jgi:2-hydroxycyclohexanecarboxyl-CoA dehydrogenase
VRVVVTGAGSGIGRATALAFEGRGADVVRVDIAGEADELIDVRDTAAMEALAKRVGSVDVLVNNAGVGMSARLLDMEPDDWEWIRSVNLDGVINGCRAFGPGMVERGRGHVVNVSSGLAYAYTPTEVAYVTTKAAVLALSRCLRADWHRHGVGVTAVCPGVIATPIVDATRYRGDAASPARRARVQRVFRRGHRPEKVADAIVRSVDRNRAVVPVGVEAWLGWYLARLMPVRLTDRFSRVELLP